MVILAMLLITGGVVAGVAAVGVILRWLSRPLRASLCPWRPYLRTHKKNRYGGPTVQFGVRRRFMPWTKRPIEGYRLSSMDRGRLDLSRAKVSALADMLNAYKEDNE